MHVLSTLFKTIIIQTYNDMHQSDPHKKGCQFETPKKDIKPSFQPFKEDSSVISGPHCKVGLGQTTHVRIAWLGNNLLWVSAQDVGS